MLIKGKGDTVMKSKEFNAHNKYMILKHALKENNVSRTCELFGISRTTFYNWQRAYQKLWHGWTRNKRSQKKPQMPNKVNKTIEQEILAYVRKLSCRWTQKEYYYELRAEGIDMGRLVFIMF